MESRYIHKPHNVSVLMYHVVVDALVSIILWWVEKYPNLPLGEVDTIFRRMMIPAIAGASLA